MNISIETSQKIYDSYANNVNFNFKKFIEDKMIIENLNLTKEELKQKWKINEEYFFNEFQNKIDIDLINTDKLYYLNTIKRIYNNLSLVQIKMYYIVDFRSFKYLMDNNVIHRLNERKIGIKYFYEIEDLINENYILEKNDITTYKYFNIDEISDKMKISKHDIKVILNIYAPNQYKGVDSKKFLMINKDSLMASCKKHGDIFVYPETLKGIKSITLICTKCFKEFKIVASPEVLDEKWQFKEYNTADYYEYVEKSTLMIFGYKYSKTKDERMEILKEITERGIWDSYGILHFLEVLRDRAYRGGKEAYAKTLDEDIRDYGIYYRI